MTTIRKQSKPVGILRAARALLKRYGWIQEDYGNSEHGYCAMGALNYAHSEMLATDS